MLRQIQGKEIIERDLGWFAEKVNGKFLVVDLGCGDGKWAFKQAQANPRQFFIAIDANIGDLEKLSNKIEHEGVKNLVCLQQSAEALPVELKGRVDRLVINYPWGSLLEMIANRNPNFTNALAIVKSEGKVEITMTYSSKYEEAMMTEYALPELTEETIKQIVQFLSDHSFVEVRCSTDDSEEIKAITSWGKRVNSMRERQIWHIEGLRA